MFRIVSDLSVCFIAICLHCLWIRNYSIIHGQLSNTSNVDRIKVLTGLSPLNSTFFYWTIFDKILKNISCFPLNFPYRHTKPPAAYLPYAKASLFCVCHDIRKKDWEIMVHREKSAKSRSLGTIHITVGEGQEKRDREQVPGIWRFVWSGKVPQSSAITNDNCLQQPNEPDATKKQSREWKVPPGVGSYKVGDFQKGQSQWTDRKRPQSRSQGKNRKGSTQHRI